MSILGSKHGGGENLSASGSYRPWRHYSLACVTLDVMAIKLYFWTLPIVLKIVMSANARNADNKCAHGPLVANAESYSNQSDLQCTLAFSGQRIPSPIPIFSPELTGLPTRKERCCEYRERSRFAPPCARTFYDAGLVAVQQPGGDHGRKSKDSEEEKRKR